MPLGNDDFSYATTSLPSHPVLSGGHRLPSDRRQETSGHLLEFDQFAAMTISVMRLLHFLPIQLFLVAIGSPPADAKKLPDIFWNSTNSL
ncbi:unnamed protein product [Nippostrongylus brasiliensis]|uniref:Ephrin RBD domain-containing protein n=1 Tax=Nippostrongylus brasiliensis TaxID=27835 RepID=A0A0N4Y3P6_NIPBR|nr:unnamed protein product [Nippostrongylus brasiliensis]